MSDFNKLLETEIPRLRRYARALTRDPVRADDLVQDCLVRAIAKQHLWQPETNLRAWLFTILHNQNINDIRRSIREETKIPAEEVTPPLTVACDPTSALQIRDLERALATLAAEQRQVILLVGLEGMRYEEVATILNIPIGTVRSRLSRGRETLRRLMDVRGKTMERPNSRRANPGSTQAALCTEPLDRYRGHCHGNGVGSERWIG
jgi:RNA polymerase sigma-70 factor (ECF subfamily)